MNAIQRQQASITALTVATNALIAKLSSEASANDAAINANSDAIDAQTTAINTALAAS
jgi:hypothetical protein